MLSVMQFGVFHGLREGDDLISESSWVSFFCGGFEFCS